MRVDINDSSMTTLQRAQCTALHSFVVVSGCGNRCFAAWFQPWRRTNRTSCISPMPLASLASPVSKRLLQRYASLRTAVLPTPLTNTCGLGSTALKSLDLFCETINRVFGPEYQRVPTPNDLQAILARNEARGWPGMLG